MTTLTNLPAPSFITAVAEATLEHLGAPSGPIGEAVVRTARVPGKLLRPRLIGLLAEDLGIEPMTCVPLAVAAELVHGGSLLHDDVIDHADERRGSTALHVVTGNEVAVLAGDFMLAKAMSAVADGPRYWTRKAGETLCAMSASAGEEVLARQSPAPVALETWERIAEGKTGALFAFCFGGVADSASGDTAKAEALGFECGVLYQWLDDLLDFVPRTKKRQYADLFEHNPNRVLCASGRTFDVPADVAQAAKVASSLSEVRAAQTRAFLERRDALITALSACQYQRVADVFARATHESVALLETTAEAA